MSQTPTDKKTVGTDNSYQAQAARALTSTSSVFAHVNDPLLRMYTPRSVKYTRADFAEDSLTVAKMEEIVHAVVTVWHATSGDAYAEALEFLAGCIHANDLSKEGAFAKEKASDENINMVLKFSVLKDILIENEVFNFRRFGRTFAPVMVKVLSGDAFTEYCQEVAEAWGVSPEAVPWVCSFTKNVRGCPPKISAMISRARSSKVAGEIIGKTGRGYYLDAGSSEVELLRTE